MSTLDWLYGLQHIGVKLGLDNMRRLVATLSPPSPPPLTFHVAGTNGKGSVCAFLDALARAHGLKTGLFTSPHLIRFHERLRIDGACIGETDLDRGLTLWRKMVSSWDPHPSFFEITLALGLWHFYQNSVDCLVLETGLGGRLDATNAVEPRHVSVITPIDLDHTEILGNSLAKITQEKAGIFRPGVPIVSALQAPEAALALEEAAAEAGAPPIQWADAIYEGPLSLSGTHQRSNAALAIAAFQATAHGVALSPEKLPTALANTHWPARFQAVSPRHTIDGAHNPASIRALVETWTEIKGSTKATVIFGCAQGKDAANLLSPLGRIARRFVFTRIPSPRLANPVHLAEITQHACFSTGSFSEALDLAETFEEPILITGSLFLAGEALALLSGKETPVPTTQ